MPRKSQFNYDAEARAQQIYRRRLIAAAGPDTPCGLCKHPLGPDFALAEADHIEPKFKGGQTQMWNLQLTHGRKNKCPDCWTSKGEKGLACNTGKSDRHTNETFLAEMARRSVKFGGADPAVLEKPSPHVHCNDCKQFGCPPDGTGRCFGCCPKDHPGEGVAPCGKWCQHNTVSPSTSESEPRTYSSHWDW